MSKSCFPMPSQNDMLEDAGCIWLDTPPTLNFTLVEGSHLNPSTHPVFFFGIPNPHLKLQGSQGGVCWSRFDVDLELPNVQQGCQQLGGGWHEDHGCQEVTNLHLFSQSHGTYLQGMLAKNPGGWGLDVARAMIFGVKLWDSNILLPSALWCCIVWLSTFFSQPSIFLTVWIVLISYDPPQTYRSLRDFT